MINESAGPIGPSLGDGALSSVMVKWTMHGPADRAMHAIGSQLRVSVGGVKAGGRELPAVRLSP